MRDAKISALIGRSVSRTSLILFKPFSLKKWLCLIFIAAFAGVLSLGNNFGGNNASTQKEKPEIQTQSTAAAVTAADNAAGAGQAQTAAAPWDSMRERLASTPPPVWFFVGLLVFLLIVFSLIFLWVQSHFKFIWFNAVANNEATVIEPFHRHRAQGNSLFKASLVIQIFFLILIAALLWWLYQIAAGAGAFGPEFAWSIPVFFKLFGAPVAGFVLLLIFALILHVLIQDFIVMIMALDKIRFLEAFKKMSAVLRTNGPDILLFYLVSLGVGIVLAFLAIAATLLSVILIVIAGLVVYGLAYGLFAALLKLKWLFIVFCLVTGIPAFVAAIPAIYAVALPFAVFSRSFPMEYLAALNAGYGPDKLKAYSEEPRSEEKSRKFLAVPIAFLILFVLIFVLGLTAAIAVPNLLRTREAAKAKPTAAAGEALPAKNTPNA